MSDDLQRRVELAGAAFAELSVELMERDDAPTCRIYLTASGDLLVHAHGQNVAPLMHNLALMMAGPVVMYELESTPADLDAYMGRGL